MFSLSKKDGKLSTLVWIVFTIFHFCPFNSKVDIYLPIYLTLERTIVVDEKDKFLSAMKKFDTICIKPMLFLCVR